MAEYTHIVQPFEPVYDENSEILILGSLPSVKSRENGFYYGHPQNRFWKVISAVTKSATPHDIAAKKQMLLDHHIALWDVIKECDIVGSSDSSIKNAVAADLTDIIKKAQIRRIYVNGKAAEKYYKKYIEPTIHMKAVVLPSTSPANAAFSLDRLIHVWKDLLWPSEGSYEYSLPMEYGDYTEILRESHMQGIEEELFVKVWKDLYAGWHLDGSKDTGNGRMKQADIEREQVRQRDNENEYMNQVDIEREPGRQRNAGNECMNQVDIERELVKQGNIGSKDAGQEFVSLKLAEQEATHQSIRHKITVWFQSQEGSRILVLMSLGSFFDDWIERYEQKEELLKAYIVECYAMGMLRRAYRAFYDEHALQTGTYVAGMKFLDVEDVAQVGNLIEKQNIQDVKINEAKVFLPQKTVAFFTWKQDEKKDCTDLNICEQCGNINCINRKKNANQKPVTEENTEAVSAKRKKNYKNNMDDIAARAETIKNNYGYRMIFGDKNDRI